MALKTESHKAHAFAVDLIKAELQKERDLDGAVNEMLDDLERSNPGEFQRFKMFPLLKKKMAKEKKVIL